MFAAAGPYHLAMRVHHLNCGSQCPFSARFVNGEGGVFARGQFVCHCLLIETDAGLVLVDTGFGLADIAKPGHNVPAPLRALVALRLNPDETALRQIEALGFNASDVRDIVVTHLDFDHAGGLPDFPEARVHILDIEHDAAMRRKGLGDRTRYVEAKWAHQPDWVVHKTGGDRWMGFQSVQALHGDSGPEVLLVPLAGHTRGHSGVAVHDDDGWLLHCGDAYFHRGQIDPEHPHSPPGTTIYERLVQTESRPRRVNQKRLRQLNRERGHDVTLFCSHDHVEFDILRGA
jgi:glyoxylase-like metal-dependent hydrolase (beta-lactamase superfamily II)